MVNGNLIWSLGIILWEYFSTFNDSYPRYSCIRSKCYKKTFNICNLWIQWIYQTYHQSFYHWKTRQSAEHSSHSFSIARIIIFCFTVLIWVGGKLNEFSQISSVYGTGDIKKILHEAPSTHINHKEHGQFGCKTDIFKETLEGKDEKKRQIGSTKTWNTIWMIWALSYVDWFVEGNDKTRKLYYTDFYKHQ